MLEESSAEKEIQIEIDGEKHTGIISLDVFSFSDALVYCTVKGLKMLDKSALKMPIHEASEYGGKKIFSDFENKKKGLSLWLNASIREGDIFGDDDELVTLIQAYNNSIWDKPLTLIKYPYAQD